MSKLYSVKPLYLGNENQLKSIKRVAKVNELAYYQHFKDLLLNTCVDFTFLTLQHFVVIDLIKSFELSFTFKLIFESLAPVLLELFLRLLLSTITFKDLFKVHIFISYIFLLAFCLPI